MSLLASTSKYVFPTLKAAQPVRQVSTRYGAVPYTLHAQCSSNNTIFTLFVDSPYSGNWGDSEGATAKRPNAGRKIFSMSCGQEGFKKAQRGTFEAASQTLLSCFGKMDGMFSEARGPNAITQSRKYVYLTMVSAYIADADLPLQKRCTSSSGSAYNQLERFRSRERCGIFSIDHGRERSNQAAYQDFGRQDPD